VYVLLRDWEGWGLRHVRHPLTDGGGGGPDVLEAVVRYTRTHGHLFDAQLDNHDDYAFHLDVWRVQKAGTLSEYLLLLHKYPEIDILSLHRVGTPDDVRQYVDHEMTIRSVDQGHYVQQLIHNQLIGNLFRQCVDTVVNDGLFGAKLLPINQ